MNNEELILERLGHLEKQIAPLGESARALGELREDLAPRVSELVQTLIVELADVEADFQLEDLLRLTKKAMRNVRNLDFSLDQLKNLVDFALTAEPLLKSSVPQVIYFLDELERKRVFHMFGILLETIKTIGETYTTEDMDQIGGGLVRLLGVMKKLTTPQALDLLEKAADIPSKVDISQAKPAGPIQILRAASDDQVKQGLGVLLELTRGLALLKAG